MSSKRRLKNMSSLLVNNFISVFYYLGRQSEPSSDSSLVGCCSLLASGRQSEPSNDLSLVGHDGLRRLKERRRNLDFVKVCSIS